MKKLIILLLFSGNRSNPESASWTTSDSWGVIAFIVERP